MLFSEKWLRNHPQFLLYFLIHIDVLMLCRKSDPQFLLYFPCTIAHENHPQFSLHFLIHIDVLMLCRKFELFSILEMLDLSFPRQEKLTISPNVASVSLALWWLKLKNNRTNEAIEYNFFFH